MKAFRQFRKARYMGALAVPAQFGFCNSSLAQWYPFPVPLLFSNRLPVLLFGLPALLLPFVQFSPHPPGTSAPEPSQGVETGFRALVVDGQEFVPFGGNEEMLNR